MEFHPVVKLPEHARVFDFSSGYDAREIRNEIRHAGYGIGRYNERRPNMYTAPQYRDGRKRRFIHVGIDLWTPPGEAVYAACEGTVAYLADNDQPGNYGPTIIVRHRVRGMVLYALHGHLARESLGRHVPGDILPQGHPFAAVGTVGENGNWEPHLHYQLSLQDPGKPDMPGVVSEDELENALKIYPDPRIILGDIY